MFSPDWSVDYTWNSYAAYVTVGTQSATATATPTSSSSAPTATPASTPTPTPTPSQAPTLDCTARPNVVVSTRAVGGGRLEATVRAQSTSGVSSNALDQIVFTTVQNGSVSVGNAAIAVGVPVSLSGAPTTTFVLTRQQAGQASMAAFTVVDRCGNWKSFVGGGPDAF